MKHGSIHRNKISALVICVGILFLQACESTSQQMIEQGYPVAYAQGYDDGCHSGNKAGGSFFDEFKKDVNRFDTDNQYAQGWTDAFRQCESEQEALQRQTRIAIEQQKLAEQREANDSQKQYRLEQEVMKGIDTSGLEKLGK